MIMGEREREREAKKPFKETQSTLSDDVVTEGTMILSPTWTLFVYFERGTAIYYAFSDNFSRRQTHFCLPPHLFHQPIRENERAKTFGSDFRAIERSRRAIIKTAREHNDNTGDW